MAEAKTVAPSQQFVDIKEIKDGVLRNKKGGLRQILIVSGINFDLKSQDEQALILNSFQSFLNGLDFPIQFFIHSRKTNVELYLEKMAEREREEENELLKIQIGEYINFIKTLIEENAIITKSFFVVVYFDPLLITAKTGGLLNALPFGKKQSKKELEEKTAMKTQENVRELNSRAQKVINGLEQIGLRAAPLNDEELIELFYNLYNPQLIEKKKLNITKND